MVLIGQRSAHSCSRAATMNGVNSSMDSTIGLDRKCQFCIVKWHNTNE